MGTKSYPYTQADDFIIARCGKCGREFRLSDTAWQAIAPDDPEGKTLTCSDCEMRDYLKYTPAERANYYLRRMTAVLGKEKAISKFNELLECYGSFTAKFLAAIAEETNWTEIDTWGVTWKS